MNKREHSRILYVDSKDCCEMLGLMLYQEAPELEMVGISSTKNALRIMDYEKFNLFVFEYEQPNISGLELCKHIRYNNLETPILFYTVKSCPIDRQIALQNGVTDYLVKPGDLNKLINAIKELCNKQTLDSSSPKFKTLNTIY